MIDVKTDSRPSAWRGWLLVESLFWMVGFLVAQGVVLLGLFGILLVSCFGLQWPGHERVIEWVLETNLDRSFLLIGVPVLGAVFLLLPIIRLREGRDFRRKIGWRYPTTDEIIISLATVCPIAMIGNLVYDQTHHWWSAGPTFLRPFASALQQTSLDHLYSTFHGVPYPILIVTMALAPAFAEELIFRGVLGRRLVMQFGIIPGVLLSSFCFAVIHGSVPHAVATFPIAILLHLLYIQTGTIWIPVLVHFCNNLLAVSLVHFQLNTGVSITPMLICSLSLYLVMMLALLSLRSSQWHAIHQPRISPAR
ncbi:MAG TPA: CPBP family intramembrane glutamic endopeptidase [Planctomicrobium sp.]|nr:CPBP family intramembrane glutamic endopeptidase [Planctomicrobium sp.]